MYTGFCSICNLVVLNQMEIPAPTPERIEAFKKLLKEPLNEVKASIDPRDHDRILNDSSYTSLFLRWSKNDQDAVNLAVKCLKWRKENAVNDLTVENIGEDTFKKGYIFLLGRDLAGNRVFQMRTGKMQKKDKEANTKLFIFWLERIQRQEPGKRVTFIMDTTGSGLTNSDMGFVKFVIECFTSYFPCMLVRTVVYNLPSILNAMWKLVSKMLSKEQSDATVLCGRSEINKYVDDDNLPESMGGQMKFEYSFPPFPDDLE
uniref:Motile sperm domain-containing protein 2 n=1 Tax=Phallusia mammillata TaxID=59560 RepID=A0A6F9DKE4_9ASCI|nr:motile sperm domain-containing protein 2 [Phallusia mammillata]